MYKKAIKRILDFSISLLILCATLPLFALIALVNVWMFRGNPFFVQTRTGYRGKPIRVFKFKTMRDLRSSSGDLLHDDLRLTRISKFFRKINLDELPQLLNILKGEMSFIGPRPLPIRYEPLYSEQQFQRHGVRPGITGLAQVHGRRSVSWKNRLNLDLEYIRNISFTLDLVILFKTTGVFFDRSGSEFAIDQNPETYLPDFSE
jgi:undecaprenyl phosphate N,N'-diacetylbacillosamine 1-phosphate transferase